MTDEKDSLNGNGRFIGTTKIISDAMKSATIIYFGKRYSNNRLAKSIRKFQIRRIEHKQKHEKISEYPLGLLLPPEEVYIRELHITEYLKGIWIRLTKYAK